MQNDFIAQSDRQFGEWMSSALLELNLELDAMAALLAARWSLADYGLPAQHVEAQLLERTIRRIRWAQRIDWSSILRYLDSTEDLLIERRTHGEAQLTQTIHVLGVARTTLERLLA